MIVAELHEHLTARWAETLWPHPPPDEWLSVFAADPTGDRRTIWARTPLELATRIEPLIGSHNLWLGVATRLENLGNRRGTASDCGHIAGLWFDLDINGPNHTRTDYPPDEQTAMGIVAEFPLPPTIVVHTGGGLQPWWLFTEPHPVDDLDDLLEAWAHTWTERFNGHGYHIDNVFDISRVMRIPGTLNHKTDPPQPVRIWESHGDRYGVDDIDQYLTTPPPRPAPTERLSVPYIGPQRPGDAFNAAHTGSDVLSAAGWAHVRDDATGAHYRHPTATAQTSATVYTDDGHTTIWTDSYPNLEPRRPYDPFGLHTALYFDGDWRASTRDLAQRGYGERPVTNEDVWAMAAQLAPTEPPPASELAASFTDKLLVGRAILELEPPEPMVGTYIDRGMLAEIVGPFGSGKSFLMIELGLSIATGRPWMGQPIHHTGEVVYVMAEGAYTAPDRIEAWMERHHMLELPESFKIYPERFDLTDPESWAPLREALATRAVQPAALLLDTRSRLTSGDENAKEPAERLIAACDEMRALVPGMSIIIAHHTGHATSGRGRGHSSFEADIDVVLALEGQLKDGHVTLLDQKQKARETNREMFFVLEKTETGKPYVRPTTEPPAGSEEAGGLRVRELVFQTIESAPGAYTARLIEREPPAELIGVGSQAKRAGALRSLVKSGEVYERAVPGAQGMRLFPVDDEIRLSTLKGAVAR